MKIEGTNIAILNKLDQTRREITRSLQKLSSGSRLPDFRANPADAARLVNLTAKFNEFTQRIKNINSAQGLLGTTSTAIGALTEIVQRMRELSVQAANGTLSTKDRENITKELMSLRSEYDRVVQDTEFNGIKPLNGTTSSLDLDGMNLDFANLGFSQSFTKKQGLGEFQTEKTSEIVQNKPTSTKLVDLDGDGDLDNLFINPGASNGLYFALNRGDGSFGAEQRIGNEELYEIEGLEVGDLNGDSIVDIVVRTLDDQIQIYFGQGDGQFTQSQEFETNGDSMIELVDLDQDGDLDLVTAHADSGVLAFYENDGSGSYALRKTESTGALKAQFVQIGDFNGDGRLDLALGDESNGKIVYFHGAGGFVFNYVGEISFGVGNVVDLKRADLNNDGLDDLISLRSNGDIQVHLGTLGESFDNYAYAGGLGTESLYVQDMNDDGRLDIVLLEPDGPTYVNWLRNDGDMSTNFSQRLGFNGSATASYHGIAFGDLDADGVQDMILTNWDTGSLDFVRQRTRDVSASAELSISSAEDAKELLPLFDNLLDRLLESQNRISSAQNQLDYRTNFLSTQAENHAAAIDQLGAVDIADETSKLVRSQILEQAQIAALAQSNIQTRLALILIEVI